MFREWIIENDTFMGMYFAMGESCGDIDREAKVCTTVKGVSSLSRPIESLTFDLCRCSLSAVSGQS